MNREEVEEILNGSPVVHTEERVIQIQMYVMLDQKGEDNCKSARM